MPVRFIREIGVRGRLRIYWETVRVDAIAEDGYRQLTYLGGCKDGGIHNAYAQLGDRLDPSTSDEAFGKVEDYAPDAWPKACLDCGTEVPSIGSENPMLNASVGSQDIRLVRQVFVSRLYDSPSGSPEPGDIFYLDPHPNLSCWYWENCSSPHLHVILPNKHAWDIDSRASNCDHRDDRVHRCWIRHGSPESGEIVHVDKSGATCGAGAGSIKVAGWHGHLSHGRLVGRVEP